MNSDKRYWITVAETTPFIAAADVMLSHSERDDLTTYLALDPEAGEAIPNAAGVRGLMWETARGGEPSDVNVIYFYHDLNTPVYLLGIIPGGKTLEPSDDERSRMAAAVDQIIKNWGGSKIIKLRPNTAA